MREYKIVILGSGGVGKSALTVQFVQVSHRHSLILDLSRCSLNYFGRITLDDDGWEQREKSG